MATFDNLRGGSRARLRTMRASTYPTWRDARRYGIGTISYPSHGPTFSRDARGRWNPYSNIPTFVMDGLRDLGPVDELHKLDKGWFANNEIGRRYFDHKGWFADAFQDEVYRGNVWQLPSRNGSPLYLAGYSDGSGYAIVCACNGRLETFDNMRDAAISADHLAQRMAEEAREYSERWQEANECALDIDEAKRDAQEARELFASLRLALQSVGQSPTIHKQMQHAREEHAEKIAKVVELRARIAELDMQGEF